VTVIGKFDSINAEAVEQWCQALESGEFNQGTGGLHYLVVGPDGAPESMCCLGVACHKFAEACDLQVDIRNDVGRVNYEGQGGYLPAKVAKYLGIPASHLETKDSQTYNIRVTVDYSLSIMFPNNSVGETVSVAQLNDRGTPFTEIARLLRKEFLQEV